MSPKSAQRTIICHYGIKRKERAYGPEISTTYRKAREITCHYGRIKKLYGGRTNPKSVPCIENIESQLPLWQHNTVKRAHEPEGSRSVNLERETQMPLWQNER